MPLRVLGNRLTNSTRAGRATALNVLDDLGYVAVDNVPLPLLQEAMFLCGLELHQHRSVRQEVLASRRRASPHLWQRLKQVLAELDNPSLHAELQQYLANPDSPLFAALEQGRADYIIQHWRKSTRAPQPIGPGLQEALRQRGQRLRQGEDPHPLQHPLGLAAARNIAPVWVVTPVRWVMNLLRSVPDLVIGLLFVTAVGLGPLAGVLAITLNTAGVLAKLFSEAVESIDKGPVEGVRATGAGKLHEIVWGVLPQVAPLWTSFALYRLSPTAGPRPCWV